ncbi:MAG: tRNA uridine-5-carboxymethylaminomethyl(34) synthesis GTPase MnmE [Lachnospiraceae bacterium]|nr:tRNA uridine-5-carboxymethylaminomethyl(34) synthesis GTPase MnmE [Lachnospiraceae bacterium]
MENDTIAAIATAVSPAGIGIIRVSGEKAIEIAEKIFQSVRPDFLVREAKSHTIHYGKIVWGEIVYDEVLLSVMRAPNTYTKEDIVEINCHGGPFVLKRILELVYECGARPAGPGEFTKRAFLNGRIDLSQAEAVMDVIHAENEYALQNGVGQLGGSISHIIKDLRKQLIYEIAFIESALDDPEHISLDGYSHGLQGKVDHLIEKISELLRGADNGRIMKEGVRTAIVGKPNVGKSSLLNAMLGEERAIVTSIAGTTRDTLEESIYFHGITLHLIDTAGIRETEDIVEKIGVDKAKESVKKADLILFVLDGSEPLSAEDYEILSLVKDYRTIILWNKSDKETYQPSAEFSKNETCIPVVEISAKHMEGMQQLETLMKDMFYSGEIQMNSQVYITNARHKTALEQAKKSLELVQQSIDDGMPEDFYSVDLMDAYESLGSIIGEALEDDLAEQIFEKFCMGK